MPLEHPIEIKITVGGDPAESPPGTVDKAVQDLELPRGRPRWIWFIENLTPGLPQHLPILETGQIFRMRLEEKENGSWEADAAVKLRPARRTQLPHPGTGRTRQRGHRKTGQPATSTASRRTGRGHGGPWPPAPITGCSWTPPSPGLIEAARWKDVEVEEFTTMAERWTLEGLDFLELSIRLEAGSTEDPLDRLITFSTAAAARGLNPFSRQHTKTRRILEHLAHRASA
jgi:hypothetical protein